MSDPESPVKSQFVDTHEVLEKDTLNRSALIQNYLSGALILGTILFFISLYQATRDENVLGMIVLLILFGALFMVAFMSRWPSTVRAVVLAVLAFSSGSYSVVTTGLTGNGILFFFLSVLLLGILIEGYWWLVGLVASTLALSLIGVLIQSGLVNQNSFFLENNSLLHWLSIITVLLFLIYVIVAPLNRFLVQSRASLLQLLDSLHKSHDAETTLTDRNSQLLSMVEQRRARALIARNINREISQLNSWDLAVKKMADLVHKHLEFDFVRVFRYLENESTLRQVARTQTSDKSTSGLEILVQEPSNLSGAILHGEVRVLNNVLLDAACTHDQVNLQTQSELIIPLRIGLKMIGLIDFQNFRADTFDVDEIEICQSLADHLSLMLDRTGQLDQAKTQLKSIEEDFHNLTRQNWRGRIKSSRTLLSYKSSEQGITAEKLSQLPRMEMLGKGQPILSREDENQTTLTLPISLRNQVFGAISMKINLENVPSNFVGLVENTTNRLAVALENARLLEDVQERAEREHAVSEISSRIRTAPDIERIMQTAVAELGRTLNVDEVTIQLKTADEA